MRKIRPKKIEKPLKSALSMLDSMPLVLSTHARIRMAQRDITLDDIKSALTSGWHVPSRDRFSDKDGWSYCIEGNDYDGNRRIRVGIGIVDCVVVVTVINLREQ